MQCEGPLHDTSATMCGVGADIRWWAADYPTLLDVDPGPVPESFTLPGGVRVLPHEAGTGRLFDMGHALGTDVEQDGDLARAITGVEALLRLVGVDPDGPGVAETPERAVQALMQMCDRPGDPAVILGRTFADVDYPSDQMVAVGPIDVASVCEHHLLPFTGSAWVAYIPTADRVVGLSKLARLVDHFARRPQVQERLTNDIAGALMEHLEPEGVGVVIRATHTCMSLRGVRKPGADTVTSVLLGAFRDDPATRSEFIALTRP
jgi:GTP cyclohydrolase I